MRVGKLDHQGLKDAFKSIPWAKTGRVTKIIGNLVEASLPHCQLGTIVGIRIPTRLEDVLAEVVGFGGSGVQLMPYDQLEGCAPGCQVTVIRNQSTVPAGDFLLGNVIDPFCHPIGHFGFEVPHDAAMMPIEKSAPNPMLREIIKEPLSLGVRAIDSLLTLGMGQRIGIMAGSGVGKSVLMGMMARNSDADINVIALIGERGREVREFIEKDLGPEGLKKSVVISVTSDQSPLMRVRGAKVATAIAEYFSASGRNVLFMLDSLTRVAMAQREIGNAIGEPPTTKGYTPSVFSLLPKLLERTGPQVPGHGAISALYTVLVDGDDFNDPIADAARSILDGHINLSRSLAGKGHFPAIEVTTSASRVMKEIVSPEHLELALTVRRLMGEFQENLDFIQIGAYKEGTNQVLDNAIYLMPYIDEFLRQGINEKSDLNIALGQLLNALHGRHLKDWQPIEDSESIDEKAS